MMPVLVFVGQGKQASKIMWLLTPHDHFWTTVPASSSCLISSALEQVADVPADERDLLAPGCPSLAGFLARVPDPRHPRGARHSLTSLVVAAVAAVRAGGGRSPR